MIYIVEIPHQSRPSCWSATDEDDAISKMFQTFIRHGDTPEMDASFDEWCDYNRSDLSSQRVYMNAEEAIAGLDEISGHGSIQAICALREELLSNGDLAEKDDAE